MTEQSRVVLEADKVVAGYAPGVDIWPEVDIEVKAGEIVCIVGPNGAGKSTLLKALFGLVPLRAGRVRLLGSDVTGRRPDLFVADGAAFVPQADNVFANLTVERNLRIGIYQRSAEWAGRWKFVCETFPILADKRHVKAGLLSGGQRQMVAMARALMMRPTVLLLDEPTAGLSPIAHTEVFDLCKAVNATGVSILIVEQNARRALAISDRGYVLDQGRVAISDTGMALLQDERLASLYLGALRNRNSDGD